MNVLLVGKTGMLSQEINLRLQSLTFDLDVPSRKEVDITSISSIKSYTEKKSYRYIINCAAYTQVDLAEDKKELDTMTFNNDVLEGELDDSKNVLRMNKIRYMLWVALLFVMIIILSFSYKNNASNLAMIIILIVVIILVYYGVKFAMKKLNL